MINKIKQYKTHKIVILALTTFYSFYFFAIKVFAEDAEDTPVRSRKLNDKFFGGDEPFWQNAQTLFAYLGGISLFVGALLSIVGMTLAAQRAATAKMQGNSQEFLKQTKNYAKLVLNWSYVILFTGLVGFFFSWYLGFKSAAL